MVRGIRSFHPFVLFVYFLLALILTTLYAHPIYLVVVTFLFIGTNLVLDNGKELEKWTNMILTLSTVIIILNPLFNHRGSHILGYLFNNPITLESLVQGAIYALSLAAVVILFVIINIVFSPNMFTFLFSKVSHQWTIIIMLAMRFVPQLRKNIKDLQDLQTLKGISMTEGSIRQRARNGMQFVQMILVQSLEDSITVADSMTARGYGVTKPSNYANYQMKRRDYVSLIFLFIVTIILVWAWTADYGTLQVQPYLGIIWRGGIQNIVMLVWFLFSGFLLWIEGKEIIKWKYYQHKNFPSVTQKQQNLR